MNRLLRGNTRRAGERVMGWDGAMGGEYAMRGESAMMTSRRLSC